jgi:hypothetical protein
MPDIVQAENHRIKQVEPWVLTPSDVERILRDSGPAHLQLLRNLENRRQRIEAAARTRVERERAEAVAEGLHVVIDEELPEVFGDDVLADVEGRSLGG